MKSLYYYAFSLRHAARLDISLLLVLFFTCSLGFSLSVQAQGNAIVAENAKAGNPASEWDINGAGDLSLQGFATDISYNKLETARFKIKNTGSTYTIDIYRLGYYQGNGARLIAPNIAHVASQTQPGCRTDATNGLVDCGNWAESATWVIPRDAVSGLYLAKLTRTGGSSSHI